MTRDEAGDGRDYNLQPLTDDEFREWLAGLCAACLCDDEGECEEHMWTRLTLTALRTLACNLAIGAALCASFDLGDARHRSYSSFTSRFEGWTPGCGRRAP